ncbi:MAG: hypothetical protein HRT71_16295 [Flavobacteriales bacterium]|nr:hypothetical protein [Flavobacteriales bacterium]
MFQKRLQNYKTVFILTSIILISSSLLFAGRQNREYIFDLRLAPSFATILTPQKIHNPHLGLSYNFRASYLKGRFIYSISLAHLQQGGNKDIDSLSNVITHFDWVKTVVFPLEINYELYDNTKLTKIYSNFGLVYGFSYSAHTINKETKHVILNNVPLRKTIPTTYLGVSAGLSLKIHYVQKFHLDINPTILYQVNGTNSDLGVKHTMLTFMLNVGILRITGNRRH